MQQFIRQNNYLRINNISFNKSGIRFVIKINQCQSSLKNWRCLRFYVNILKRQGKISLLHVITSCLSKYDERPSIISHTETATQISQERTRYAHQGESRWRRRFQKSTSARYPNSRQMDAQVCRSYASNTRGFMCE